MVFFVCCFRPAKQNKCIQFVIFVDFEIGMNDKYPSVISNNFSSQNVIMFRICV